MPSTLRDWLQRDWPRKGVEHGSWIDIWRHNLIGCSFGWHSQGETDLRVLMLDNFRGDTSEGNKLSYPTPCLLSTCSGRDYEAEHFATPLTSQRFRDFFEKAIAEVIGSDGRMVIFIDDLDRCEGEVAYRLLETLKLYLNARNCIYVLGLDQGHLETTIARVLSNAEDARRHRALARERDAKERRRRMALIYRVTAELPSGRVKLYDKIMAKPS